MTLRLIVISFNIFFCLRISFGQYLPLNNIPVHNGASELTAALAGGINAGQFSEVDLNGDAKMDLFIFDRSGNSFITLLNEGSGVFTYAPQYESVFPSLEDWVLLRDFNCDGIMDIFTYNIGSTKAFKGVITDGDLSFVLADDKLTYYDEDSESYVSVYTARTDIPTFDDIDFDGDLDLLSFSVSSTTIRYYKNISFESGYGCDSLVFDLIEYCWGALYEGFTCGGGDLGIVCKGGADEVAQREMHSGSTSLTFDKDEDGDKDLILGDNSCNNLVYYLNGGDSETATMTSKDTLFPSNTLSYFAPVFPASFLIDADDDGDKDLIGTTNDALLGQNLQQVWLYENLNTNDTFDFAYLSDSFIVGDMIDAGAFSKPTYFDYNNDGLNDIVIGIGSTFGRDLDFKSGLWLYKNTGTLSEPAFEFITNDLAGLDMYPVSHLAPFFADADNDGDDDLFCGNYEGTIIYCENLSGPGGEASFASAELYYNDIDAGYLSAPCLIDIDQDGKLDMIIGEMNGNLNYYHNSGTASEPAFTLESEIWGGVDVRETGYITGYSVPFMYRNENDSLCLTVGSQSGRIFLYNEIEDALLGEFYEADTNLLNYSFGVNTTAILGDINNNGKRDFLTGNIRGGIQILERSYTDAIADFSHPLLFEVYPNPSAGTLFISFNQSPASIYFVSVINSAGQLIKTLSTFDQQLSLSLGELPNGVYAIRVVSDRLMHAETIILMH